MYRGDLYSKEMETPYLPVSIFGKDFEEVYEPAEDTYLLLDALEKDLDNLKRNVVVGLECGSGSGAVITALSKSLKCNETDKRLLIATDINEHACKTTRKCTIFHGQHNIQVIRANLAEPFLGRMENQVDLLIFNPPYVPTENDELLAGFDRKIYLSWAGGLGGRQLIDTFLSSFVPRLLSKPNGVAYIVALDRNNIEELLNYLVPKHSILGSVVMQRKAGIEYLYVIKYIWKSN